jgi:hypothetical protein
MFKGVDVQPTSRPRRVLGIFAAGTIGLSTALLGVTGVAQAAPVDPTSEAPAAEAETPAVESTESTESTDTDTSEVDPEAATLDAPYAPTMIDVQGGDETLRVWFEGVEGDDTTDWADEYEYNLDGGDWSSLEPDYSSGYASFEITAGLTNGTEYAVRVRGVSEFSGAGTPSDAKSATPYKAIGAPGVPTVVTGPASLMVTWTAPTETGTYPLAGYEVMLPYSTGQSGGLMSFCDTDAATTTCTFGVEAGAGYDVFVTAVDDQHNSSAEAGPVASGVVPAPTVPASAPDKDGDLVLADGASSSVAPGKTITVSGTGYAPFSSVAVIIYSEPQLLTTVVTDADGNFTVTVTVPAGLSAGNHTLVASGVDANGVARYVTLPVTVTGAGTASLAYTGADVTLPAIGGLVAVAVGGGLILASRRRSATAAA